MYKKTHSQKEIDKAVVMQQVVDDIEQIKKDTTEIKIRLESNYVTKDQFAPVQKIVYGMVGLILVTVVGALLTLVIIK